MKSSGNYIEIAGGKITEKYQEDYNIYTGGHIKMEAAKSINQTGKDKGISFNKPEQPPVKEEKKDPEAMDNEPKPLTEDSSHADF